MEFFRENVVGAKNVRKSGVDLIPQWLKMADAVKYKTLFKY
jgi:hypothetical protein